VILSKKFVQAVLLILSGPKGKGFNYNEIKKLLTVDYSIPSQVMLASTINKPKGLRSVINKVLMQICAKVGGEPWAVDSMPFTSVPTMVIGFDTYNKFGKQIIGCSASYNRTFTKYISVPAIEALNAPLNDKIKECVNEAAKQFEKINKTAPQHIIFLRDGLNSSRIAQSEANALKSSMEQTKFTYVLLNKKNNLKVFFCDKTSYSNIPPGTLIDDVVVSPDQFDFYLISQKSNQGLSAATHYNVIFDNFKVQTNDLHLFLYKLCYLYYNWTGGIRVPAPCHYAKKLAYLVGDKISTKKEVILPNSNFTNEVRTLYFL